MDAPATRSRAERYWLLGFGLAALSGIVILAWLFVNTDPAELRAAAIFVLAAGLAVFGLGSFLFFLISLAIFSSKRYRGNTSRAAQQGLALALIAMVALALQLNRALNEVSLIALAGLLLVGELYLALRR